MCAHYEACVRDFAMVPLVGNICTIGTNLITNGTIGKDIGANGNTIGTNVTNPEHTRKHAVIYIRCIFSWGCKN